MDGGFSKMKATKVEAELRVKECIEMLSKCWKYTKIVAYGSEKWGIQEPQIREYCKTAREEMGVIINEEFVFDAQNRLMNMAVDLYEKNYAIQDYKECRMLAGLMADLTGAKAPIKTETKVEYDGFLNDIKPPID